MKEKRFVELLEENNKKIRKLIDDNTQTILTITNKRIEDLEQKIDEKIMDNNFYLEKTYGDKFDSMFEKIMLMDEIKNE